MFRELEELAPRVYMFPRDDTPNTVQPNIGVLRLDHQTILIDAGNSPRHAHQIMAAMAGQNFPPIETIIYTHHHWDHTFAAATYKAKTIIAHHQGTKIMAGYASRQWNAQILRESILDNPRIEVSTNAMIDAIPDWREFRIAKPTIAFHKNLTLYYDEMTLELEHVGGKHAPDSIAIRIPESGVIFVGDSYYPTPFSDDDDLALGMLDSFLDEKYTIYVDGHGAPRTYAEFANMIAYESRRQELHRH